MKWQVRKYLQLGRVHTAMLTVSGLLFGAFASGPVQIDDIIKLSLIGFWAHVFGFVINEIIDRELDARVPECQVKPLVSGAISLKNAWCFLALSLIFALGLSVLFYPEWQTIIIGLLSLAIAAFYSIKGKRIPWAYDFSLPAGVGLSVLFGASAVHRITPLAIIMAVVTFWGTAFLEWIGAMKDVETDRNSHIPTRAVAWGYSHDTVLTLRNRNLQHGYVLKLALVLTWGIAVFLKLVPPCVTVIFFLFGVPTQIYLMVIMLGKYDRKAFLLFNVKDGILSYFMTVSLLLSNLTCWGGLFLFIVPLLWYMMVNLWINGSIFIPRGI